MRRHGNKFNAVKTEYKGRKYDSKAEANYAVTLDVRQDVGEVRWWLRQVCFDLGEDTRYRADFLVAEPNGGTFRGPASFVYAVDVKGVETPAFRKIKKLWAKYAPIRLHVVKGGKTVEIIEGAAG